MIVYKGKMRISSPEDAKKEYTMTELLSFYGQWCNAQIRNGNGVDLSFDCWLEYDTTAS